MKKDKYGLQKYSSGTSNLPAKLYKHKAHIKAKAKSIVFEAKEIRPRITQAKLDELLCRIKEGQL